MNTGTSIVSGGENSNMDIQTLSVLNHTFTQCIKIVSSRNISDQKSSEKFQNECNAFLR